MVLVTNTSNHNWKDSQPLATNPLTVVKFKGNAILMHKMHREDGRKWQESMMNYLSSKVILQASNRAT
jgi:hypothetical protein